MSKKQKKKQENKTLKENKNNFYKKNYKKFLILPITLFIISIILIITTLNTINSPIYRDVSLKGGLSSILEINSQIQAHELQTQLQNNFKEHSFSVSSLTENGKNIGYIIDTDIKENKLIEQLKTIFPNTKITKGENYTSNYISPTLSNSFFTQALFTLLFSLIFMSLVVFLYFKQIIPSTAVILSAIFDIIVTVGVLNLIQYKISISGIGAIIMLIGYSIDTDILLTNRLIKEKGTNYFQKTFFAFKTGTLMSITTLIAAIGAMIITNSQVIFEITLILTIGLIVDYISTWIQNTGLLLWWLEKKK